MNYTNLTNRQKLIVDFLEENGPSVRSEITQDLSRKKTVSRITVIRDLNQLNARGVIEIKGKAKATRYYLVQRNPLLQYIELDQYFEPDFFGRNAKKSFNHEVFESLSDLYSKEEINYWEKSAKEFAIRAEKLDPSIYKREMERFIIDLSWKSSQIEGNTYSLIETETLIKQKIEAKGHPKEEAIMILNHKSAFDSIMENKETFKNISFSDVIQLHGVLTKRLISSGVRSQPVRISGTIYTPPRYKNELEKALRLLVKHINNNKYPPEKALIASVMIAYIQPFADGNKRTSRMLSDAILLAHGYFPLSYRDVDVNEYRKSILLFYEQNNLYHFKRIFIEQVKFAVENYFRL